jgi:hypothetical protein
VPPVEERNFKFTLKMSTGFARVWRGVAQLPQFLPILTRLSFTEQRALQAMPLQRLRELHHHLLLRNSIAWRRRFLVPLRSIRQSPGSRRTRPARLRWLRNFKKFVIDAGYRSEPPAAPADSAAIFYRETFKQCVSHDSSLRAL